MVSAVSETRVEVSDVIAWELDGNHRPSRDNVVVAASQTMTIGLVVTLDGTGKVIAYADGTATDAVGIYVGEPVTTGVGETAAGVIIARDARYAAGKLTFDAGADAGEQTAALGNLAALGILPVRSV